jgi:hypothetical protein
MDPTLRNKIIELLHEHRIMTMATNRPDGWPQATTAARAHPVSDPTEMSRMLDLLVTKYPEYAAFPKPKPEEILIFRVVPEVIPVLDYSRGFGHADLVTL